MEWGDNIMLQVLANILRRNIRVVRPDDEIDIPARELRYPEEEEDNRPILLGHLPEVHYYSLESGKEMEVNDLYLEDNTRWRGDILKCYVRVGGENIKFISSNQR